jgi:hypothetical protein
MNYILDLAFQSFWHFIGVLIMVYLFLHYGVNASLKIISRFLRSINIFTRGWPPSHLDADGDFKQETTTNKP